MKIDLKKLFMGFSLGVFSFLGMVFLLYKMYLPAIVVIVLAFLVSRKIKVKRFWILLLVVSFLIRLAAIVVFNFPQTTDFKLMYECALKSGFDFCNFLDCLRRLSNNLGLFSLT